MNIVTEPVITPSGRMIPPPPPSGPVITPPSPAPSVSPTPSPGTGSMDILVEAVNKTFANSPVLRYFYSMLYSKEFHPDINGYCLIYMVPPDLSGYNMNPEAIKDISRLSVFLAVDFSPPDINVEFDSVMGHASAVSIASELRVSNQLSVSYIDSADLQIYSFHSKWTEYIRDLTHGKVAPKDEYLQDDFPIIDYAGAIYCIKFKPAAMQDLGKAITFVSKAYGVFPVSLPDKEIIGTRSSNDLSIISVSYVCSEYRRYSPGVNDFVLDELINDISATFGGL